MTRFWSLGVVIYVWTPVISSRSRPLNGNASAAESLHQEAEIAYGKHSSPEAVKTFIIITNLQAPTEPEGADAAKQALQLLGSHISPRCIRRLDGSFFAGHTKSYLLAHILLLRLSSRLRDGMKSVYVCISLWLSRRENYNICVSSCTMFVPALSQQTEWY